MLKLQPERVAELFLAHAEHQAPHAHATPDILVDRVRRFLRHALLLRELYDGTPRREEKFDGIVGGVSVSDGLAHLAQATARYYLTHRN